MYIKKFCPKCNKLIDQGKTYCDKCQLKVEANRKLYAKDFKKRMTEEDKKYDSFYKTMEWILQREVVMRKYVGLDIYDYFINNKTTYADMVHHIVEVKEDWDKRLDIDNLIPLSEKNHRKVTKIYKTKGKEKLMQQLYELKERWEKEIIGRGY